MGAMPEVVAKGPILKRIDVLSRDRETLEKALADLRDDSRADLVAIGVEYGVLRGWKEVSHVRDEWFRTWWPQAQPVEPIIRQGLITAIETALAPRGGDNAREHLPLDVYWVCHPGHGAPGHSAASHAHGAGFFEATISWSDRQVTLLLHSPGSPYEDEESALVADDPIKVVKREGHTGELVTEQVKTKAERGA